MPGTSTDRMLRDLYGFLCRHRTWFLLIVGLVVYVAFLGLREVWYPDEPDIAEVAKAMFVSGDWISPRRMGVIWVDYPPMIYWIGTLSSHVFGEMSAFSLRLPNALAALLTIIMTARVAQTWYGRDVAFWTGCALLTFLLFVYEGNSYRPDVMFTLTISAGMFSYAAGSEAQRGPWLRVLAFAFFGVAMLSKGPLGLMLPGLVLVIWLGLDRRWLRILELAPLSLVALAVYGAWFFSNADAMGWSNMLYEFYAQNLERFLTSENRGHGQPWFYYLRNFWLDFSPWSWLFPVAIWWIHRTGRWGDRKLRLALLWFFIFMAFLSIAATKRQLYFLPAFPAAALIIGQWLADASRPDEESATGRKALRIYSWTLGVAYLVFSVLVLWVSQNLDVVAAGRELNEQQVELASRLPIPLLALGTTLLVAALVIVGSWRSGGKRGALLGVLVAHLALYVVVLSLVFPSFEPVKTYRPQSEWISSAIGDEPRFGMVDEAGVPRRGGFSYYTGTDVDLLDGPDDARAYLERYPDTIILVRSWQFENDFGPAMTDGEFRMLREIRVGSHLYYALEPGWLETGREVH